MKSVSSNVWVSFVVWLAFIESESVEEKKRSVLIASE